MAIGNQSPLNVSKQDLENPDGLARLGFKLIGTVSTDGDRVLADTIFDTYNEHELIMALLSSASIMANAAAESEKVSVQEVLSRFSARVREVDA